MTSKLDEALNIVLSATDALKSDKFKFDGNERMGPKKHPKCKGSYDAYSGDTSNYLRLCPVCGEKYLGDGAEPCTECAPCVRK